MGHWPSRIAAQSSACIHSPRWHGPSTLPSEGESTRKIIWQPSSSTSVREERANRAVQLTPTRGMLRAGSATLHWHGSRRGQGQLTADVRGRFSSQKIVLRGVSLGWEGTGETVSAFDTSSTSSMEHSGDVCWANGRDRLQLSPPPTISTAIPLDISEGNMEKRTERCTERQPAVTRAAKAPRPPAGRRR